MSWGNADNMHVPCRFHVGLLVVNVRMCPNGDEFWNVPMLNEPLLLGSVLVPKL